MSMAELIIIVLAFMLFILAVVCIMQNALIIELRGTLKRISEMYRRESDRSIQKMREDIFLDDQELLKRWL